MKNAIVGFSILILISLLSSCATIVGGMKYNAQVVVPGHPDAQVLCNVSQRPAGKNRFKIKRQDADKVVFTVTAPGCGQQTTRFYSRKFRGWSFVGTVVGFTGLTLEGGDPLSSEDDIFIPVPWGIMLDGMTGAWWKPDEFEAGVEKYNLNNYVYTIDYKGCETSQKVIPEIPKDTGSLVKFYRRSKNEADNSIKLLINDEIVHSFFPLAYTEIRMGDSDTLKVCPQDEEQDCSVFDISNEAVVYVKISQLVESQEVIIEKVSEAKGEFESTRPKKKMGY